MTEEKFIETMVDLMDTEMEITMGTLLSDIEEWDSLSYVAYLAMCAGISDQKILPKDVKTAKTIRDLYQLLEGDV